jgi:hypothetical protein
VSTSSSTYILCHIQSTRPRPTFYATFKDRSKIRDQLEMKSYSQYRMLPYGLLLPTTIWAISITTLVFGQSYPPCSLCFDGSTPLNGYVHWLFLDGYRSHRRHSQHCLLPAVVTTCLLPLATITSIALLSTMLPLQVI